MTLSLNPCTLHDLLPLRALYLQEHHCQIRYNACHERGWADEYLCRLDDKVVGYGSVKGLKELRDRDAIFEFYVLPPFRQRASDFFAELITVSGAQYLESQTNDALTTAMVYAFGRDIHSEVMLFADHITTHHQLPGVQFRNRRSEDDVFGKAPQDMGAYVLEQDGIIVADGGFLLHYNHPFADLYMEVAPDYRRQGYGQYIIQELKKACYLSGRVPAARCNIANLASQATLRKGGLTQVGHMIKGTIR